MADSADSTPEESEQLRVAEQIGERLRRRGITMHGQESADDLATLLEAVESFEAAVEKHGGDLMVDEPPVGGVLEPDNPAFVLPERDARESALAFASRIDALTAKLRAE